MILLTLCQAESTSDFLLATTKLYMKRLLPLENLAVLHSPDGELHWLTFAWLCLALDRHWNFVGRYFFMAECFHAFDLN